MKNIGLTMRVDIADTGEVRDALDCSWAAYIQDMGFRAVYLPHRLKGGDILSDYDLDALLLTGGNDVLESGASYHAGRNSFEEELLEQAKNTNTPVLGVCRGMQMINHVCGGSLSPIEGHVAQDHMVEFEGQKISVNSYHNYGILKGDLAEELEVEAYALDGSVEAFSHKDLPWHGIMWHPERDIDDMQFHAKYVEAILSGKH